MYFSFSACKRRIASIVCLSLPSALVFAGQAGTAGTITFQPSTAQSIPTLGGTMLILLALLLGFIAFISLRNRHNRGRVASFLALAFAAGSLVSAVGGITLVRESHAALSATPIVDPQGETLGITQDILNQYINNAGVPMNVTAINLPATNCPPATANNFPGACILGAGLAPGATCEIDCSSQQQTSDMRLKTDIEQVGFTYNGLPLYHFRYIIGDGTMYEGVMAQDVLEHTPEAVVLKPDGYLAVDYGMLGLRMTVVK